LNQEVILIGTVHRDPQGYTKLYSRLCKLNPSVITVEVSQYALKWREMNASLLKDHLLRKVKQILMQDPSLGIFETVITYGRIRAILSTLDIPYEYRAALAYSKFMGIQIYPIDSSMISRSKLGIVKKELLQIKNLIELIQDKEYNLEREIIENYLLAHTYFRSPQNFLWHYNQSEHQEIEKRDKIMAKRICLILRKKSQYRLVHIGGWEHLIEADGFKNLYFSIKDLQPLRSLLD
jgi:hypothetical protein